MKEIKKAEAKMNFRVALNAMMTATQISIIQSMPIAISDSAGMMNKFNEATLTTINSVKAISKIINEESRMLKFWRFVNKNRNKR